MTLPSLPEILAEIDRSVTEVSLFEGDTILGVEGVDGTVSSESDLIDVLRGVNYPINLRINRDGDVGIGTETPTSKLHIQNGEKRI